MDVDFLRYRYEDGYYGVIIKNKFKIGVRHIQLVYMVVASVVMGSMRGTVGVGLLAMTDLHRRNDSYIQIHDWDRRIQGTILSAYFFGYAVMYVPTALYLHRFSSKLAITAALLVNGSLCVAIPTIANRGGWIPVCNAYLFMGMTQAVLCPAHQTLMEKWFPPGERKIFNPLVYGAILLGVTLALPITHIISEFRLGWELVFYSQSMLTLSLAIAWFLLTSDTPDSHPAVGDKEKEFLKEALSSCKKIQSRVPWRSILSSKQFWCLVCAHATTNAIFIFYLTEVPLLIKYFKGSLQELICLPLMVLWLAYVLTAPSIELIYKIGFITYLVSLTHYRKIINTLGATGVVIGLTLLPHLLLSGNLMVVVLCGTMACVGLQYSGFLENFKDMSENYAGSLVAAAGAAAGAGGAVVPLLAGLVVADDEYNTHRWRSALATLTAAYVLGNIIYIGFSSSDRQHWDTNTEKFGYHNGFMHDAEVELEELQQTKLPGSKQNNLDTAL